MNSGGFLVLLAGVWFHLLALVLIGTGNTSAASNGSSYLASLSEVSFRAPQDLARATAGLFVYAYFGFSLPVIASGALANMLGLLIAMIVFSAVQIVVAALIVTMWKREFARQTEIAFPEAIQNSGILSLPELTILLLMLFWLWKTLRRPRTSRAKQLGNAAPALCKLDALYRSSTVHTLVARQTILCAFHQSTDFRVGAGKGGIIHKVPIRGNKCDICNPDEAEDMADVTACEIDV